MPKLEIKNLTLTELEQELSKWGEPAYRARQIFGWLYKRLALSFDDMTDLPAGARASLKEAFEIANLRERHVRSHDGTVKMLITLKDGLSIESVMIPMQGRTTLCISSQVGCPLACSFCVTGKVGFKRNLDASEIVEQVVMAKRFMGERKSISNIVFMGMGEPLLNYDNVVRAVRILNSPHGFGFPPLKITVSTAGITPMIERLAKDVEVKLAVSLNAPDQEARSKIMPVARQHSLQGLLKVLAKYPLRPREKITFEYVVIKGVNDSEKDALKLVDTLAKLKAKVNLIPLNESGHIDHKRPPKETMQNLRRVLEKHGIPATVRDSKGLDISAACGQLAASLRFEKR